MTDTPPDWAFQRAQELRKKRGFTHLDAFAAYIAEHELPAVDRKLLCAREASAQLDDGGETEHWHLGDGDNALTCCLRSLTLYEDGFGK